METDQPPSKNTSRKTTLYFSIAIGLLFLLAFVWSIDNSIVYFLSGGIVIFIILALFNVNYAGIIPGHQKPFRESQQAPYENPYTKKETTSRPGAEQAPLRPKSHVPIAVVITIGFILFAFASIFVLVLSNQDNGDMESEYFFQQGEAFYSQAAYDSAAIYYRRALAINAESDEALTGYGNTLLMREQYDSALVMYERALDINPDYTKASYQKGAALSYQKNYDQSISALKKLLDVEPTYFDAMQLIGDNYYNKKSYDSALSWYDDAAKNGVQNRYLFHLMGYIYETKGNKVKAISLYKEAIGYDSAVLDLYQRLGELLPGNDGDFYRRKAVMLEQPAQQ